ncbi:MAG: beta-galactosidase [Planctomycetes bacterium]|nr:beta-galactosidase [Planctomycetota bacterium]
MDVIRDNRFHVSGLELHPNSAEFHYWRVKRQHWPFCFKQIKEAGFKIVSTYVPWNHHEYERGKFDFSGETDPQRDLLTFLKECRQTGFRVILKPGPWICAEWKHGGLPEYLFETGELVARDANDEPLHAGNHPDVDAGLVPCYAHPEYLKHVRTYFTALVDAIREHLHPNGNVFLIQLDNEPSHCHRGMLFDADYHQLVTDRLYPRYLQDRYKDIERLNSIYLTDLHDFSECAPPRKLEVRNERDIVKYFDWVEFKERYLATYLLQLRRIFDGLNVETGFFANIRWGSDFCAPTNWPMLQKYAGLSGIDIFGPHNHYETQRYIRYLEGVSPMPWSPEFMAGRRSDHEEGSSKCDPISDKQRRFGILAAMAAGLRGANFYMFVERDHWHRSPVSAEGRRSEGWDFYRKLNEIVTELDYFEVEKVNNVGVVHYQPYTRYSFIDPEKPFDHVKNLSRRILPDLCIDLGRLGVDYTVVDPAIPASLEKHDVLFIPIADFLDDNVAKLYEHLAQKGKRLVFFGVTPTLDLLMRKSSVFSEAFGVRSAHHFVVESMQWNDMSFKTSALGRLRLEDGWEPLVNDKRDNVYSARRRLGEGTVHFLGYEPSTGLMPVKMLYLVSLLDELGAHRPAHVAEPLTEAYIKKSEKHTFLFLINPDENVREEFRASGQNVTLDIDIKLLGMHADSITFVNLFTGETRNEPLVAVRDGVQFTVENYDAQLFQVIPEYGR